MDPSMELLNQLIQGNSAYSYSTVGHRSRSTRHEILHDSEVGIFIALPEGAIKNTGSPPDNASESLESSGVSWDFRVELAASNL